MGIHNYHARGHVIMLESLSASSNQTFVS